MRLSWIASLRARLRRPYAGAVRWRQRLQQWSWQVVPGSWRRPYQVASSFDSWGYLAGLAEDVSAVLGESGVEHLLIPQDAEGLPRIVVRDSERQTVRRVLATDPRTASCWLAMSHLGVAGRAAPIRRRRWLPGWSTGAVVSRNLVSSSGQPLGHSELGVTLDFWAELAEDTPSTGGGLMAAGTLRGQVPTGVVDHIGPTLWRTIQDGGHRLPAAPPHLFRVSEPVDLVYTWVDGSDPAWQARKAAALGDGPTDGYTVDAAIEARFASRDELRYSLRSVEMFANWVRRIWLVTDQQVPDWLRQDERLQVVDHREIFTDTSVLPVFNSHAIESQLHHVPGLAELYLYLNDDMMFGAPVRPEDFFHSNGITKFFTSQALVDVAPHLTEDLAVTAAAKHNRDLIEATFGRTITNKLRHSPQPQSRQLLAEFEAVHPEVFATAGSRLRSPSDYSLPSSLSQYYAFAQGRAVAGALDHGYVDLASPTSDAVLALWLRRRHLKCLCINDSGDGHSATRAARDRLLREFFEAYYPLPSRWETPSP